VVKLRWLEEQWPHANVGRVLRVTFLDFTSYCQLWRSIDAGSYWMWI